MSFALLNIRTFAAGFIFTVLAFCADVYADNDVTSGGMSLSGYTKEEPAKYKQATPQKRKSKDELRAEKAAEELNEKLIDLDLTERKSLAELLFDNPVVQAAYKKYFAMISSEATKGYVSAYENCLPTNAVTEVKEYYDGIFDFKNYKAFYIDTYVSSLSKKQLQDLVDFSYTETYKNFVNLELLISQKLNKHIEQFFLDKAYEMNEKLEYILEPYIDNCGSSSEKSLPAEGDSRPVAKIESNKN